jgi:hypothetical protein
MIKFSKISQIEHGEYPFEDAVVNADVLNGAFGDVADGVFTPSASGKKIIMQNEVGDDAYMAEYKIPAGSHVRVLDPAKVDGELELYGNPLPATFKVGDTVGCFTITEVIGNKLGAVVKVTE